MKLSIVTVCYNAAKELEATMLSVLEQDYPNVEYIVIDGGSTDGSVDIIRKYSDRLAYWVSEPDKGIYDAMNKALTHCTGTYVNFMNAGDRFASPTVLSQIAKNIETSLPTVVYGDTKLNERGVEYIVQAVSPQIRMHQRLPFCHQSAFTKVNYHKQHLFDTSYKCCADYNLYYRAYFMDHVEFMHIPIIVAIYDEGNGYSKKFLSRTYREKYRIWGIENNYLKVLGFEIRLIYRKILTSIRYALPASLLKKYRK